MTATQAAPQDDVRQLEHLVAAVTRLRAQVAQRIVGQEEVVDGILTAILAGGHALLIGVPGLAKTLMVQTVAEALDLTFNRVQFTPDLIRATSPAPRSSRRTLPPGGAPSGS
jgi:MoxR-like ATPase